jgi:hypothetical protein
MTGSTTYSASFPAMHLGVALAASLAASGLIAPSATGVRRPMLEEQGAMLRTYGDKNAACLEWSDACAICKRGDDGKAQCSTVGIACVSGDIVCKAETPK